jgi:hypothetical protein
MSDEYPEVPRDLSLYEKGREVLAALAPIVQAGPGGTQTFAELTDLVDLLKPDQKPEESLFPPLQGPKASRALAVLRANYQNAVGLNIFDSKVEQTVRTALRLALAIVQDEQDRISESYRNSGEMDTPDQDAVDAIVDMLEIPEPLSALLWGRSTRKDK